jgi:hypothetical protein
VSSSSSNPILFFSGVRLDLLLEFHISLLTFGLLSFVSLKKAFAWLVYKNDGQSSESSRIFLPDISEKFNFQQHGSNIII